MELALPDGAEILIDGAWVQGRTDARHVLTNPATLTPIGSVPECGADEIAAAASAARRSLAGWSGRSAAERGALLEQAGQEILRHAARLAASSARETGQVYWESMDNVRAAAAYFRRAAQSWTTGEASAGGSDSFRAGCVAALAVAPEYPLLDWACAVSRLLQLGSTVVCIPPPDRPLTTLAAAGCLGALPPGVINVLTADDGVTRTLGQIEGIDRVVTRQRVQSRTDSVFVSQDADLGLAVAGAASLRLFHSGQRRGQSARIYVEQPVAETFADRLHEFMAFLEAGDPCKRGTDLGPLSSAAALAQVENRVGGALRRGMSLKLGGRRYQPWGLPGYFFQPTILVDRSVHEDTSDDHIGGPVAIVCPVPDLATAVRSRSRNGARALVALFADDPVEHVR